MIKTLIISATHLGGGQGEKKYLLTVDCPEDLFISIIMAEQLFLRNCVSPVSWKFYDSWAAHKESPADEVKLNKVRIISCREAEPEPKPKLFKHITSFA